MKPEELRGKVKKENKENDVIEPPKTIDIEGMLSNDENYKEIAGDETSLKISFDSDSCTQGLLSNPSILSNPQLKVVLDDDKLVQEIFLLNELNEDVTCDPMEVYNDVLGQNSSFQMEKVNYWNIIPGYKFGHDLYVDEDGIKALEFFSINTSRALSIGPDASNYLVKTFMPLAMTDDVFQNAIASWGSIFLKSGSNESKYRPYMLKAMILIQSKITKFTYGKIDKSNFFILLCFYIIAMSVEICSGDTYYCHQFYTKCLNLIRDYGGYKKVITDFRNDNDIKWLLSNLQYHDTLSSHTAIHGSVSRNDFDLMFREKRILDSEDYGIDPFQGCNQSIYLVLGDIINHDVLLKQEWEIINYNSDGTAIDSTNSLAPLKKDFYKKASEIAEALTEEIWQCKPNNKKLELLMNDNLDQHLLLFELFRFVCYLYLLQNIKKVPPVAYESQMILQSALEIVDKLLGTRMMTCMAFPILVCGMTCTEVEDREEMRYRLKKYSEAYSTGNVKFVSYIMEDSWKRNPEGNTCLNWAEIAQEKGWTFFMS